MKKSNWNKYKKIWVWGIIGMIWGLFSFFIGVWSLEELTLKHIFLYLPFYISYKLIGRSAFFISPIIGGLIGLFIGYVINRIIRINKNEK